MNFDVLRQKILEKAICGQLVPQSESEPAVDQFGETPEGVLFAIPEKWKWVSLGAISNRIHYGYTASAKERGNARLLRITDIQNGAVNWNAVPYCSLEEKEIKKFQLASGDIVIARTGGTIGKSFLITQKLEEPAVFASYLIRVIPDKLNVNPSYLLRFLDSSCYWEQLSNNSRGTGQPNVNARALFEIKVPLPPIEEQYRIVSKINQLFAQIDRAKKAYNELSGPLSERFRQLCLEKAIQGKLVPQLESEPVVNQMGDVPDNCPFRLPKKWKWVKLGAAFSLKAGKFISASEIKDSGAYPCYGGNGKRGYVDKFNREGRFPLIGRQGALCGNINLVDGKFYATEHAVVADGGNIIDPDCAAFFLKALNLNQYATKTAQPGLSVKRISKTPFPLAPIQEQKRIVKKIQDLLLEISSIKQS